MTAKYAVVADYVRYFRDRRLLVGVLVTAGTLSLLLQIARLTHGERVTVVVGDTTFALPPVDKELHARPPPPPGGCTRYDGLEWLLGPIEEYGPGFTIVSPTFHRTDGLPKFLGTYATGSIPSLRHIVLVWNNEEPPPASFNESLARYAVPVSVERPARNTKNERFRATPGIRTAAVFAVDDDVHFQARDVEAAFQAWRSLGYGRRRRMVGFFPREASADGLYLNKGMTTYSMVLTKAAFVHIDWMRLWWADTPLMRELRDYVDSKKMPERYPDLRTNCEDILMSFLYARYTREPPLWVDATFEDDGLTNGISAHPGHFPARTECVRHFMDVMGHDTLVSTSMYMSLVNQPIRDG